MRIFALGFLICLLNMDRPAIAQSWSLELGGGAVFQGVHGQVRPGVAFGPWEIQLLYALGINNFNNLSHTLGLHGRYLWRLPVLQDWGQHPYLRVGAQTAFSGVSENRSPWAASIGLGMEGQLYGPVRYSTGLELLLPDIYSRSPFVFRPELSLRWVW